MTEVGAVPQKRMVKRKPARKQVEVGFVEKKAPEQTGTTFNVWYGKWAGGDKYDEYNAKEKSQTRVNIATDAGYTRADEKASLCMFFARGSCPYGQDCAFLHRLPKAALPDSSKDIFGREKHSEYRDDMGGVGSFHRINRTLYVGKIKEGRNTAGVIEKHFEEFGDIERIKILTSRGVAFVTYESELSAQFAKEAMMCQSLDDDEVINVRWATEDPNPAAGRAEAARLVEMGEAGIAKGLDPDFVQAIREMDELEGLVEPREASPVAQIESAEPATDRPNKRARIEAPLPPPEPPAVVLPTGLLSAHALDSLKFVAGLRNGGDTTKKILAKPAIVGLGALADYGSDSD